MPDLKTIGARTELISTGPEQVQILLVNPTKAGDISF